MEEVAKALQRLAKALESAGVVYVIVGGLVAIHYGRDRATQDIDVVIETQDISPLLDVLRQSGFEFSEQELEDAYRERGRVTLFLPGGTLFHVDLKFAKDAIDYEVLRGRVKGELMGIKCWLESVEDVVVAKLLYGSGQDEEDVVAILLNKGVSEAMKEKAKEFGVYSKLCGIAEMVGLRC
ncbi:hypothetical protein HS7_13160 [Sulfolobales archaeon HS-7]|nr:hypothetical protein HS7_13160 [Sulfolobales archaeon HS-7]